MNRRQLDSGTSAIRDQEADVQNALTESEIEFRKFKAAHEELSREVESLRRRRSNIPGRTLTVREELCRALELTETDLPFVGELIEVRPEERAWEGAAERVLHGFALSLLVPDNVYTDVAEWVDQTHIGDRLVYFRVRDRRLATGHLHAVSLARKLALKADSSFYGWLLAEHLHLLHHLRTYELNEGRFGSVLDAGLKSLAFASRCEDELQIAIAESTLGIAYQTVGDQRGSQAMCEAGMARAAKLPSDEKSYFNKHIFAQSYAAYSACLWQVGQVDRAAAIARNEIERAEATENFFLRAEALVWCGHVLLWRNDWTTIAPYVERLWLELPSQPVTVISPYVESLRGGLLHHLGDVDEGISVMRTCLAETPRQRTSDLFIHALLVPALIAGVSGVLCGRP